jgi:exonuclease 1
MDPVLAKQIALGDIDPVTHLPMDDINPGFVPRPLKPLPLSANSAGQSPINKGKGRASSATGGILRFFG